MTIESVNEGEDAPLTIDYVDPDTGDPIDPDDTDSDGTPEANITITDNSDGTEVISSTVMTNTSTGAFEYVWDTDIDGNGAGRYAVKVTAEFNSETKINKSQIEVK